MMSVQTIKVNLIDVGLIGRGLAQIKKLG